MHDNLFLLAGGCLYDQIGMGIKVSGYVMFVVCKSLSSLIRAWYEVFNKIEIFMCVSVGKLLKRRSFSLHFDYVSITLELI